MLKKWKEYPKTVLARRSLVVVIIIGVAAIVTIILINLYMVTHQKYKNIINGQQQFLKNTANEGETSWYKGRKIRSANLKSHNTKQESGEGNDKMPQNDEQQVQQKSQEEKQAKEFYKKAMSAPITANQLTNQQEPITTPIAPKPQELSPGMAMPITNTNDQNMQTAKKAFLQENSQAIDDNYLHATLKNPLSPYEIKAGTIIPGILITGLNSDLPGQITAQVRANVYDTMSGNYLLIPQGSKLTGVYDSQVVYGQERVLVVWRRIIFPNGKSIDLQGMPGIDLSGYAGFKDQVNNHYGKIFGSVLLISILGAGAQLSQPQQIQNPLQAPTIGQTLAQSLGINLANTGTMLTSKNINIQPTLEIRPGYLFNIGVTKDMVFPEPYSSKVVISN